MCAWVSHHLCLSRVRSLTLHRSRLFHAQPFAAPLRRGDLHFITFSCYRRRPFLGTPRTRHRFVKILDQVRSRYRFLLIGYVVMPEHVHLLISEPKKGNPSKVLQVLKQKVSRALRKRPKESPSAQLPLPSLDPTPRPRHFGSAASTTSMCGATKTAGDTGL